MSDSNNQCVQCFGPNGELRLKFGSRGRSPGQLQRPTGVCALPNGNFAVADYENRVVSVFDATGPKYNLKYNFIGPSKYLDNSNILKQYSLRTFICLQANL